MKKSAKKAANKKPAKKSAKKAAKKKPAKNPNARTSRRKLKNAIEEEVGAPVIFLPGSEQLDPKDNPKITSKTKLAIVSLLLFCFCFLSSCRVADFTMLSTKNVEMSQQYTLKKSRAVGRAMDLKTAVDRCIEDGGGTYITNVVIYDTGLRYKVVGDVYGK